MKEFDPYSAAPDNKSIAAEHRQVRTEKRVTQLIIHPGHTCFEFDLATGNIETAKIETVTAKPDAHYKGVHNIHRKILQRENCLYCSALNKRNAVKKFAKQYDALVKKGIIQRPNKALQEDGK